MILTPLRRRGWVNRETGIKFGTRSPVAVGHLCRIYWLPKGNPALPPRSGCCGVSPLEWGAEDARGLGEGKVFSLGMTVASGRLFSLWRCPVFWTLALCINKLREIIRQVEDKSCLVRQQ